MIIISDLTNIVKESAKNIEEITENIASISQSGKEMVSNLNTTTSITSDCNTQQPVSYNWSMKTNTQKALWIVIGFTMLMFVLAVGCKVIYDKSITDIVEQLLNFTVPVTLGLVGKFGAENIAEKKYSANNSTTTTTNNSTVSPTTTDNSSSPSSPI